MVEANIRNLSRIELLYTCVARLVQYHHKNQTGADLAGLEHYLAPDDRNRVIYHSRHVDIEVRTTEIVRDAEKLLGQCQNQDACSDIEAYQLLLRCIEEQTISENGIRRLRNKGTESPQSDIPSEPNRSGSDLQQESRKATYWICCKYRGSCRSRWFRRCGLPI